MSWTNNSYNYIRYILLAGSFVLLISCESQKHSHKGEAKEGILSAEIFIPAGELIPKYSSMGIPTFFNIGKINIGDTEINTIALGARTKQGKLTEVYPVAHFSFESDTITESFILSVMADAVNKKPTYELYLTENADMVSSIEGWFRAQCGLGRCRSFIWEDYSKELKELY